MRSNALLHRRQTPAGTLFLGCVLLGCVFVSGCAEGDRRAADITVDTLESGTILVHNGAAGVWSEGEAWRTVEVVRIGSADAADPLVLFGDVWDVTLDALGRIYVLDRQPNEVRVFDETGRHVRTLGREGGGPGEFRNPIRLAWGPDHNLWVLDEGNARYSVFDTAGNFRDSHSRRIGGWGYAMQWIFDETGRLYEPGYAVDPATGEYGRVYIRHSVAEDVVPTDTFGLVRYDASASSHTLRSEGGLTVVGIPFAPRLTWHFDGVDGLWFAVNDAFRLYHSSLAGDTSRIVERETEPIPVGEADRQAIRERFASFGEPAVNQIIARVPAMKPAFETFVVDDRGYLWVVRTSGTGQLRSVRGVVFDVFDPDGRYLGAVQADVGTYPPPRIIGDRMVGVVRDELDVPYIVLHRIEGR
jgi:hypothetical protein